jgi:hypothetical protein
VNSRSIDRNGGILHITAVRSYCPRRRALLAHKARARGDCGQRVSRRGPAGSGYLGELGGGTISRPGSVSPDNRQLVAEVVVADAGKGASVLRGIGVATLVQLLLTLLTTHCPLRTWTSCPSSGAFGFSMLRPAH